MADTPVRQRTRVFALTSKSKNAGAILSRDLKHYLNGREQPNQQALLDDLAHTLFARRSAFAWRTAFTATAPSELISALEQPDVELQRASSDPRLGFVFTGQGAQWHAMGRELIGAYPVFKQSLLKAEAHLQKLGASWSLLDELSRSRQDSRVNTAAIGQPLCTAIQIALVDLLAAWNVKPAAVVGHSSGEITAAYACGALEFESALTIAYYRGAVVETIGTKRPQLRGAMLAVGLSEEETRGYIAEVPQDKGEMVVACVNSPQSVTVSGDRSAIIRLQSALEARQVFARRLKVDTAYHSHHMAYIASDYQGALKSITTAKSNLASFISSVTGEELGGEDLDTSYWVKNMVSPVRFSAALLNLCLPSPTFKGPRGLASSSNVTVDTLVEIGPHSALAGPIKQIIIGTELSKVGLKYMASLVRDTDTIQTMAKLAGELFMRGLPVNLDAVNFSDSTCPRRVLADLPSYPWDHSVRHWHESRLSVDYRMRPHPRHHLLGAPCSDFNPLEPRWRNIVRISELPWLKGHVVQSSIVYPAAGYIAMALEASRQRSLARGQEKDISRYRFRNVSIGKALLVPDDSEGVETMFCLRPYNSNGRASSTVWDEFRVFSYSDKEGWCEHCRGLLSVQYEAEHAEEVEGNREAEHRAAAHRQQFETAATECRTAMEHDQIYQELKSLGLEYSELFTSVVNVSVNPYQALGRVRIPDSAAVMPNGFEHPHVLHPGTLDSCMQMLLLSLMETGALQQTMVPTTCEELSVSSNVYRKPGEELHVHCSSEPFGHRGFKGNLTVVGAGDSPLPMMEISGLVITSLAGRSDREREVGEDSHICYEIKWAPDVKLLRPRDVKNLCMAPLDSDGSAAQRTSSLRALSLHFITTALRALGDEDVPIMKPHHQHYYAWMKQQSTAANGHHGLSQLPQEKLLEHMKASGSSGQMLYRIGRNIVPILKGEVEPLSLMMEDDLLYSLYQSAEGMRRNYVEMAEYVSMLTYKKPGMNILEIGAGTGGATLPLLKALDERGVRHQRLWRYTFTDISSGFFENAKSLLEPWEGSINFQQLDIEKDPQAQGFEVGIYDLVVAANVLHATRRIDDTVRNVRRLLRPDGKLLLLEGTRPALYGSLIYGTLPGWWLGVEDGRTQSPLLSDSRWNSVLSRNSFSGLDVCIPDYPDDDQLGDSVLISTAVDHVHKSNVPEVEIVCGEETSSSSKAIVDQLANSLLKSFDRTSVRITALKDIDVESKICICLIELQGPVLKSCTGAQFDSIKTILSSAKGVLWVTRGGAVECASPEAGLITGLARSVRSDNPDIRLVTLDLDSRQNMSYEEMLNVILDVFHSSFDFDGSRLGEDLEYAERAGRVLIPRLGEAEAVNDHLNANTVTPEPRIERFFQDGRPLRLEVGTPGMLDSLRFIFNETALLPLAADELRIELRAAGVNFRDIMVSLGQLESSTRMAGECSGVVTEVGTDMVGRFQIGDRVCAWGGDAYANSIRVKGLCAKVFPNDMTFEEAASIPVVWATAYYSLVYLARLEQGETVLIHSAAGGVGQAAIMLSQHIGAKIFVTVSNREKKAFLMENYNIPEEQIFSSRKTSFVQGIKRLTSGKGVDVVLNSLAGEMLRETCDCIAPLGRFIEIGKRDTLINTRLDMSLFERNVTFASVDLTRVFDHNSGFGDWILEKVIELIRNGAISAIKAISVLPISDIESAFRRIQAGKHIGKVVLKAEADSTVKVLPRLLPPPNFSNDASYLVVGGLGGLGKVICQWMARMNAKNIIVLSRSGLQSESSRAFAEELKKDGVKLVGQSCDIYDAKQLQEALRLCERDMPPIRGVIQAAMVLKDCTLKNMTVEDYRQALRPKVQGGLNLHQALFDRPLDFFINLSSCAGIIGNNGQGNYASASTFQDAFARYRTGQGLMTRSLDIGMVESAGFVSENPEVARRLYSKGLRFVKLDELLALINYAITAPVSDFNSSQLILGIPRRIGASEIPTALLDAKFSQLQAMEIIPGSAPAGTDSFDLQQALRDAPSFQEAARIVCDAVIAKVSRVLAIPTEDINAARAVSSYGADSLVSVELRNWFTRQIEANVEILELLSAKSITDLAADAAARSKLVNPAVLDQPS